MLMLKLSPSAYAPNAAIATSDAVSARLKPSSCLLLLLSHSVTSDSLQPHGLQHARLPCSSLSPKVCSNSCPWSLWCYLTISSSATPFSFCLQYFTASGSSPMSHLFTLGGQSTGTSVSSSVLPMNVQGWSLYDGLVWSPCCPRDSQESSLAPQFKGISSSVLSLLEGPALTSIHDYWKNHSFEYMELWSQLA